MASLYQHPAAPSPMPAAMAILSRFDREKLAAFVEIAIDLADAMDGDTDLEPSGDELDGTGGEDDFCDHNAGATPDPGCQISDPGGGNVEDEGEAVNEDGGAEVMETLPAYGSDQSLGPINSHLASQRHDLLVQMTDFQRSGSPEKMRHLANRLRLLDVQEAHLIEREG